MDDWWDDWMTDLAGAAARARLEGPASAADVVVAQEMSGATVRAWTLRLEGGRLSVEPGRAADAQAVLHTDEATARALAQGTLAAADALAAGLVRASGDVGALVKAQGVLAQVGDVLATRRAGSGVRR
ncbi:MAG: SCP2 sterol-binding domain-containing protein [Acidimicrobiales bacterium]